MLFVVFRDAFSRSNTMVNKLKHSLEVELFQHNNFQPTSDYFRKTHINDCGKTCCENPDIIATKHS